MSGMERVYGRRRGQTAPERIRAELRLGWLSPPRWPPDIA